MSFRWSLGLLAVPAVLTLVIFLAFSSQWLFSRTEPGPLDTNEFYLFNSLIVILLICYARAVLTDPGHVPADWKPTGEPDGSSFSARQRWCRKCKAYKPPRAHHCKICKRCIPKMDHHCPWTANCVSHLTYPHFLRFVGYADVAIVCLEYFLCVRAMVVWENRHMPSVSPYHMISARSGLKDSSITDHQYSNSSFSFYY
jgi:palmitoyltransferase